MSAFNSPKRVSFDYIFVPPEVHIVAYATGGYNQLYEAIKSDEFGDDLKVEDGSFTDKAGKFQPHPHMPILGKRYKYITIIGSGESAIVIRARDIFQSKNVAIKILHSSYKELGYQEAYCMIDLAKAENFAASGILRFLNMFCFAGHFCIVFELLDSHSILSYNISQLKMSQQVQNLSEIALSLLKSLGFLQQENMIHGDIKPDNIHLKKRGDFNTATLVDYGNAIHCVHEELSLYFDQFEFQTLIWRAPEVVFGIAFGLEVDVWSLGCVLAELHFGKPIFYGTSKEEVLTKMTDLLGKVPVHYYQRGKFFSELKEFTTKTYQCDNTLNIMTKLGISDFHFANFLSCCFKYNPSERLTVTQAMQMPFMTRCSGLVFCNSTTNIDKNEKHKATMTSKSPLIPVDSYPYRPIVSNMNAPYISSYTLLKEGTSNGISQFNSHPSFSLDNGRKFGENGVLRKIAHITPYKPDGAYNKNTSNNVKVCTKTSQEHSIPSVDDQSVTKTSKYVIKPTAKYKFALPDAMQQMAIVNPLKDGINEFNKNTPLNAITDATEQETSQYDNYINPILKWSKLYIDRTEKLLNINKAENTNQDNHLDKKSKHFEIKNTSCTVASILEETNDDESSISTSPLFIVSEGSNSSDSIVNLLSVSPNFERSDIATSTADTTPNILRESLVIEQSECLTIGSNVMIENMSNETNVCTYMNNEKSLNNKQDSLKRKSNDENINEQFLTKLPRQTSNLRLDISSDVDNRSSMSEQKDEEFTSVLSDTAESSEDSFQESEEVMLLEF